MENSSLNGAQFNMERFEILIPEAFDAYSKNLKVIEFYSFGSSITHHGTVIKCENDLVLSIHIYGNENNLLLSTKITIWNPSIGEPVFEVSDVTFRELYDSAIQCCRDFGKYDALFNNCQTWNNNLLKILNRERRTSWSWITTTAAAVFIGVVSFLIILPPIMTTKYS